MARRARDAAFLRFVTEQRRLLHGTALLMFTDPRRAQNVLQSSLAELYRTWPKHASPLHAALGLVLHATPGGVALPGGSGDGMLLADGFGPHEVLPPGIIADLAVLSEEPRRTVILQRFCRLSNPEIATVTGAEPAQVEIWGQQAAVALTALDTDRGTSEVLHTEMVAAVEREHDDAENQQEAAASDLANGRLLVRRRRLRSAVLVAAVLVAGVLGFTQVSSVLQAQHARQDQQAPRGRSDPTPVSAPAQASTSPAAACDMQAQSCRDAILHRWRTEVAKIATSYVDPQRTYFSGGSSSLKGRYDLNSWWRGQVGALELDLAPKRPGATEVHLEFAATKASATRCGQRTGQTCASSHSRDRIILSATKTVGMSRGIEVQYSAVGEQVISVVARNTSTGKKLEITKEQLMGLVTDPRLRLPPL